MPAVLDDLSSNYTAPDLGSRIFFIDDEKAWHFAVSQALEPYPDLNLHCALPSDDIVTQVVAFKPTVILLDLRLAEYEGLELADQFNNHDLLRDVPIVVMSSNDQSSTKSNALSRGANDFLVKLPDGMELAARMRQWSRIYYDHVELKRLQQRLEQRTQNFEDDIRFAEKVQRSVLTEVPKMDYVRAGLSFLPCGGISGDFYHFNTDQEDGYDIFVGDATGHGIAAAFISMMAHVALFQLSRSDVLEEILSTLNATLVATIPRGHFMTAAMVRIREEGTLIACSAGHPPVLIAPNDGGELKSLNAKALPLGITATAIAYTEQFTRLKRGDKVLIYTDGIYEWENQHGEAYGEERLREAFSAVRHASAQQVVDKLYHEVEMFCGGGTATDDITVVCLEYTG